MTNPAPAPTPFKRLLSLDILRGVTIAFMIMVNNNGGPSAWAQMQHAEWNGLTATDLVFPTFLFVVGASIVFAYQARLAKGSHARSVGLAHGKARLHSVPAWDRRQRLSAFSSRSHALLRSPAEDRRLLPGRRTVLSLGQAPMDQGCRARCWHWRDIGCWCRWVPVPGAGMPGRDVPFLDKDQNIVAWLDRQLMPNHLYEDSETHNLRDPEGLLSDIPALGTTLLGLLAGLWSAIPARTRKPRLSAWSSASVACLASGYFWSIWLPLNKKMWTSSYVLVAAGWSLSVFALAFWAVEIKGWGKETVPGKSNAISRGALWPWLVFGSNAIAAYMVSELLPGIAELFPFTEGSQRMDAFGWAPESSL